MVFLQFVGNIKEEEIWGEDIVRNFYRSLPSGLSSLSYTVGRVIRTVVIYPGQMLQQFALNAYHQMQLQAKTKMKEVFVSGKEHRGDTWKDCSLH
eukprot:13900505-Ditylum_brightwellii.AAC.1